MAEIVNLNKFRKKKARADAAARAAENRVRFGRTNAQKERDAALEIESQHRLDQLRREATPSPEIGDPPSSA
ncbi:MAG: hypothetical protein K0Q76_1147 [Panacagrimonas sp.]|jgi:hypothetical protein|nr:DUF4169 family protein [Panacagrimonas sp.]MCC2656039.1 hypothetical protein [Panacagrimonas sp.]